MEEIKNAENQVETNKKDVYKAIGIGVASGAAGGMAAFGLFEGVKFAVRKGREMWQSHKEKKAAQAENKDKE